MRPAVHTSRKQLPGHIRQRVKRAIDELAHEPRPPSSKKLNLPVELGGNVAAEWEVRRIRLVHWRIVYAVNEVWNEVAVLAIHKRPPYEYDDLDELLTHLY